MRGVYVVKEVMPRFRARIIPACAGFTP